MGGNFTLAPAFRSSDHLHEDASPGAKPAAVPSPHILLIAGGVGINPLYSMLMQLAATGSCIAAPTVQLSVPFVTLLWSVRTLNDAFLLPQLRALAHSAGAGGSALAGRLRLVLTVTRQPPGDDVPPADGGSTGRREDSAGYASSAALASKLCVPDAAEGTMSHAADAGGNGAAEALASAGMGEVLLRSGRMDPILLRRLSLAPALYSGKTFGSSSKHAFVCGPPSMTECASRIPAARVSRHPWPSNFVHLC